MSRKSDVLLRNEGTEISIGYLTEEKNWEELASFPDRDSAIEFAENLHGFTALPPEVVYIEKQVKTPPTNGLFTMMEIECEMASVKIIGRFEV